MITLQNQGKSLALKGSQQAYNKRDHEGRERGAKNPLQLDTRGCRGAAPAGCAPRFSLLALQNIPAQTCFVGEPKEAEHTHSVLSQAVGINAMQIKVCGLVVVSAKNVWDMLLA